MGQFTTIVSSVSIPLNPWRTSGGTETRIGLWTPRKNSLTSPRVGESPVSLECRLEREIALGEAVFVVGEIVAVHVDEGVLTEGRVDVEKLKPVGRLGGDGYSVVRDAIRLPRPRVERAAGTGGAQGVGA